MCVGGGGGVAEVCVRMCVYVFVGGGGQESGWWEHSRAER